MVENSKTKIDVRVVQERDPVLFEVLNNSGRPAVMLREIVTEWMSLKEENEKLKENIKQAKNDLTGIKLSARQAQKNTEMILGIMNAWLFTQQVPQPFSREDKQHPYLSYFDTEYRNMLDRIAQQKVYNDNKKRTSRATSDGTFLDSDLSDDSPF
jgi:hypothetical protein